MGTTRRFTASIEREGDGYVAPCPELDTASQGDCVREARGNLLEAVELFPETADDVEVQRRLRAEVCVTRLEVVAGWAARVVRARGQPHRPPTANGREHDRTHA